MSVFSIYPKHKYLLDNAIEYIVLNDLSKQNYV